MSTHIETKISNRTAVAATTNRNEGLLEPSERESQQKIKANTSWDGPLRTLERCTKCHKDTQEKLHEVYINDYSEAQAFDSNQVPSLCSECLVGWHVPVKRISKRKWQFGCVETYDPTTKRHCVRFSDGDKERTMIDARPFDAYLPRPSVPKSIFRPAPEPQPRRRAEHKPWKAWEDALLFRLHERDNGNWKKMRPLFLDRTEAQLQKRFENLCQPLELKDGEDVASKVEVLLRNGGIQSIDGSGFGLLEDGTSCQRCGLLVPSTQTGNKVDGEAGWCESCMAMPAYCSNDVLLASYGNTVGSKVASPHPSN